MQAHKAERDQKRGDRALKRAQDKLVIDANGKAKPAAAGPSITD